MRSRGKIEKRAAVNVLEDVRRKRPGLLKHPYWAALGCAMLFFAAAGITSRPGLVGPGMVIAVGCVLTRVVREIDNAQRSGLTPDMYPPFLPVESEQEGGEPEGRPTAVRPRSADTGWAPVGADRGWFAAGAIGWDGKGMLTVGGGGGAVHGWETQRGGIRSDMRAAPFIGTWVYQNRQYLAVRAQARVASGMVAEIAAIVDLRRDMVWRLLFLDEYAQELASIPVLGFVEGDVREIARAAGVRYRTYDYRGPTAPLDFGLYFPAARPVLVSGPADGVALERWRRAR